MAEERTERVREEAKRIASQILVLTRNGLFVSLRFLDLALCQFEYLSTDKMKGIATTGQHIVYNSQYVIESYMKDRQALSRDYLHMVLHCIFRHPFVSENLNEEYWNLAADIAVETIIDELDLKQTATQDREEVSQEVARIKGMMKQVTAEHVYQLLLGGSVSNRDIERWKKVFYRDDHRIWWEIAKQIAEEMERRKKEEQEESGSEDSRNRPPEEENQDGEQEKGEDGDENGQDEESDETDESGEESETDQEDGEDSPDDEEAGEEGEESDEESQQDGGEDSEEDGTDDSDGGGEEEESGEDGEEDSEEDGLSEEEFEEEYSSTPGQTLERENPDDIADPDSDTQESDRENNDSGSGGGKPGDNPQQSEEEGSSRKNDQTGEGLDGTDDHHKPENKNNGADSLSGSTDEGRRDDSQDENPFSDQQQGSNSALGEGGSNTKSQGQQGQKSAGTGGGGEGSQSAWQHDSGGANRRGDGEKNEEDRRRLEGNMSPGDEQEISSDDQKREEAVPTEASPDQGEEEKEPSFMHGESDREALKDKWKDISERMLVDLQTSSKEWGDKSDTMLQGVKKLNRDKYDYSTFLRKFATMREDIQINPDEFDYVYYTYGMQRYGNIPLIEPLEYKEVKKVRDFVIAIDTSGSCAGEVVQKFLDKTYSLFTQQENFFKKINLHIIQCDAEIQSDVKITCRQEFDDYVRDLEFRGFGGTDFRPVFEYVNELIERGEFDDLKGLIYFTDGNGTYPKRRPPYETAFVFVDDDEFEYEVPSWAMKLVLETTDIMEEVLI